MKNDETSHDIVIDCPNCNKTYILVKNTHNSKTEYLLKLDCSKMKSGMESWYEDSIPKYSNETYA